MCDYIRQRRNYPLMKRNSLLSDIKSISQKNAREIQS